MALLHCYVRDVEDKHAPAGKKLDTFFHSIIPWRMVPVDDTGSDGFPRSLVHPAARCLNLSPSEIVIISDRCFCEKLVALLRGGAKTQEDVKAFCINFIEFTDDPQHKIADTIVGSQLECFARWQKDTVNICKATLAISGYGDPGSFDNAVVKRMLSAAKGAPQCGSAVIQAALQTNPFWQAAWGLAQHGPALWSWVLSSHKPQALLILLNLFMATFSITRIELKINNVQ